MINARLQDLEMRLPPEPVMRPPLRADQRQPPPPRHKSRSGIEEGAMEVDGEAQPSPAPTPRAVKKAPKKGAAKRPTAPPPPPPSKGKQGAGQADATPPPPNRWNKWRGGSPVGDCGQLLVRGCPAEEEGKCRCRCLFPPLSRNNPADRPGPTKGR
ncbi:basic salivary proline-rich protein 4-like [Papilio machaon]|uniref:basic salivary proline-rich protein 4-like n=1 Tax=Papilio machaon TaxID=76193 RepID=UPI001E664ED6|nr:basic salivary proline-rich protein 4-like [Papilio machaon]